MLNRILFVDIDDTTFTTGSRVKVLNKNNQIVSYLTSSEYAHYQFNGNELFDFSEFEDSEIFYRTAKPIKPIVNLIKFNYNAIKNGKIGGKIIFLTARTDMNDKQRFLDTFIRYGINVKDTNIIYISRAGNHRMGSIPEAKIKIVKEYLDTGMYNVAQMYDDLERNLRSFLSIRKDYSSIKFMAYKVFTLDEKLSLIY